MRNRVVLLTGWGLGTAPLEPLAAALRGLDERLQVQVEPLPVLGTSDPHEWIEALDANLPQDCWLGGWSLGGMLAAALAERRGERCCGLLGLASNVRFVAQDDWPTAMPGATFQAFYQGCEQGSAATLKRFALLCSQGAEDARGLGRLLQASAPHTQPAHLLVALQLLAALDTRSALQGFRGPQLHLFAGNDALVPAEAARALLALQPDIEVGLIDSASHAFPLECPHEVAAVIQAFFSEVRDD